MAITLIHTVWRFFAAVADVIDEAFAMRNAAHKRNPGLAASE